MFYTQKKLGWSFDWSKIKKLFEEEKPVIEWRYYVSIKDNDTKMQSYLRYLNAVGFAVFTKPLKKIAIGDNQHIYKGNCDVEIAIDAALDKSKSDEVVLMSGDSDFKYLAEKLKNSGKNITVVSSRKTVSWEMKLAASRIIYFENIKGKVVRTAFKK